MRVKILIFLAVLASLALAAGACSLRIHFRSLENATPTPEATPLQPSPTPAEAAEAATPTSEAEVECASPVEPGLWTGPVELASTASGMGFRIIDQQAAMQLLLEVACDGSITGVASRSGNASINVPLSVDGACTDVAEYDVTGAASGDPAHPTLDLELSTRQGALSCDVNSRLSSVPSGEQSTDLAGQTLPVQVTAASASPGSLEGNDWPDRLYQDQMADIDSLIEDADLTVERTSSWRLTRQAQ